MTDFAFTALRPMKLSELLDRAIRLYRRNFLQFIGIIAIPYIPLMLIQAVSSTIGDISLQSVDTRASPNALFTSPAYWLTLAGSLIFLILYFILIQGLATAALTRAISDTYAGQPVGILSTYRRLGGSAFRLFLALLWLGLLGLLLSIWMIIPCVGWISGPGVLIFLMWIVLPLVAPVVVLEGRGALASTRRAWDLARTRFWWLIGFVLILYLFAAMVISGPTLLVSWALRALLVQNGNPLNQQLLLANIVQTLLSTITGLLYLPLQLSAITVVYFDLRVRAEGLDLALQAASHDEHGRTELPPVAPTQSGSRLLAGRDVGNLILLTLAVSVGYVLVFSLFFGAAMAVALALAPR